MKYSYRLLILSFSLLVFASFAQAQQVPTGRAISLDEILDLGKTVAGFLFFLGHILGAITIIASGVVYLGAGANPQKVKTAKDVLKAGIIGTLILYSSGIIVRTIEIFAANPLQFFNSGSSSQTGNMRYGCVSGAGCVQQINGPYTTSTCDGQCAP